MSPELLIESSLRGELSALLEAIFIFEGRIDLLKKQHEKGIDSSHDSLAKHREPHDIIDHFATNADPSKNKKHTQQILSWYKDKQFRQEDAGRVRQVLKDFESHGKKLPKVPHPRKQGLELPGHDISSYSSFHSLNKSLDPFRTSQENNFKWGKFSKDDLDHINGAGTTVIHDDPKYTVREVHDQRAMDILGKGADWCVVSNKYRKTKVPGSNDSSSMWDYYKEGHPGSKYYHVHDKETGERFAAHPASNQHLFDVDDREQGHNPEIASKYQEGMFKTLEHLKSRAKVHSPFIGQKDLHDMRNDPDLYVKMAVAKNTSAHHETLHAMSTDEDEVVRRGVAKNTSAHPDTLHAMSTDPDPDVKKDVVWNTSTHHRTLHAMRNDPDVKMAVAKNTRTHHGTLHAMRNDPSVKGAVADNLSTHHKTLHAMRNDPKPTVREAVVNHPNIHPDTLHAMHNDPDRFVRDVVASRLNIHPDTLHAMRNDPDSRIKFHVASRLNHPDTLHAMRNDPDHNVKMAVAKNINTHHDTLHAMHTDPDVKLAVASNTNTHHDTLHAMHTDPDVKWDVAGNKSTHPDTLHAMSTDESNPSRLRDVARKNLERRGLL